MNNKLPSIDIAEWTMTTTDYVSAPTSNSAVDIAAKQHAVARIHANHARFAAEIKTAETHLAAGRMDEAVLHAHLAAAIAAHTHAGVFGSMRIERLIHAIAAAVPDRAARRDGPFKRKKTAKEALRVLHVGTEVIAVGGLTRMISRWINADAERVNSFAVTRQRNDIPEHLVDAVARSGGTMHRLNTRIGSQLEWVQRLREIGRQHDLIVLHIHCEDLIPLIAFAQAENFPPVLLLNHADHLFWLGQSVSHAVLSLREAAHDITANRRGVAPQRSLYLPTLVDAKRRRTREQARETLKIEPDTQLIISVARGAKYRTIDGVPYADRFVDVLKANPQAQVLVVGSDMPADWERAYNETGGRIKGLPEQSDVALYFEAADIYVDSYPFSSSTSLMEAACFDLPLLTLFTLPDEARLLGINHLGLIGGVLQARTPRDWDATLTRLIREPDWRRERALDAGKGVGCTQPKQWRDWLEAAYQSALNLPPLSSPPALPAVDIDTPRTGEPDWRHEAVYGSDILLTDLTKDYMGALSLEARLRVWRALQSSGEIRGALAAARLMLPEWLKRRLKS